MKNIFLYLAILNSCAFAGGFDSLVSDFEKQGLSGSSWGIAVYSVSGKKIYSRNEDKKLVPASSVKLFPTAFAFECLGPEYRIKTELYLAGEVVSGELKGDVVLKGYGDISFGALNFEDSYSKKAQEIYSVLKEKGIDRVNGSVFVDSSFYSFDAPGSWAWEDIGNYYAAFPWAFSVNDNLYRICFESSTRPGTALKVASVEPDMGLEIDNQAITGNQGSGDNSYIYSVPWEKKIKITGSAPAGYCIKGAMGNPPLFFATYLNEYFNSKGIVIKSRPGYGAYKGTLNEKYLIKTFLSPALKEIVSVTNKKSFNLYAEGLYRLASIKCGKGENPLESFAASFGARIRSADACGLSRLNLFSASDFIKLLNFIASKPYFARYRDTLYYPGDPAGRGHVRNLDREEKLGHNLAVKSGSLKYVRSYAGYLRTRKGKEISFAFIINNYESDPAFIDKVHGSLLKWLYDNY